MLTAASIARMVVPSLALVAAGGALLFFGVPQVRRELPVEGGVAAAARSTVGAASLAAPHRSSDSGDMVLILSLSDVPNQAGPQSASVGDPIDLGDIMRKGKVSKREVLKLSTTFVVSTVFAKHVRAAPPGPSTVTPTLIESADPREEQSCDIRAWVPGRAYARRASRPPWRG
jgi:hypothetical protein